MAREKEIKIQLTTLSFDAFIERIVHKGFVLKHELSQEDIYFDTKDWYLYEHIAALRFRKVNGKDSSFSFKKVFYIPNKKDHYYIEELEIKFPIVDSETYKAILQRVGIDSQRIIPQHGEALIAFLRKHQYLDEQHMSKMRKVFVRNGDEIVIDTVKNVGTIIELECQKEEPMELMKTLLHEDEWERSIEGTSYMWLTKVKGLTSHITNMEKFKNNPSWNVWKQEIAMYESLNI